MHDAATAIKAELQRYKLDKSEVMPQHGPWDDYAPASKGPCDKYAQIPIPKGDFIVPYSTANDPVAYIAYVAAGTDGIQLVNADKAGTISSIQLTTGGWVRMKPQTLKAHLALIARLLLSLCYPAIGFLVPWGAIRAFVWVADGFTTPLSSS